MKTYLIVGAVVGAVTGLTASLMGIQLSVWLTMGAGIVSALIAGQIEHRKKK